MNEYRLTARFYDFLLYPVMHPIRKKVVEVAKKLNPGSIIDICCGTGDQLKYLKREGFENIHGVDLSDAMLEQTQKGHTIVQCRLEDASQMAFNDNEFELGIISFALHEKPGEIARKIVQEAFRVIKPGGYLLVIDYMLDKSVKPSTRMAIHLVERMAGRDHYRCFRDYHRYGGLDALLPSDRIKEEHRFHSGGIRLRLYSYSVGKTTPGN